MTPGEALRALHRAGRIREPYLPGMVDTQGARAVCGGLVFGEPDLTDPATVGCLAALAREASGDPLAFASHSAHLPRGAGWCVVGRGWARYGPSEGDAWAAVLVALAGAL